ncbi:hypothetical protein V6C27_15010, partial [Peptococcaceae bacterium 1198_IL3148]
NTVPTALCGGADRSDNIGHVFVSTLNLQPSISVSSPSNNPPFSAVTGHDKMTISGNVTDQDVGDVLNIYYRIDSGSK